MASAQIQEADGGVYAWVGNQGQWQEQNQALGIPSNTDAIGQQGTASATASSILYLSDAPSISHLAVTGSLDGTADIETFDSTAGPVGVGNQMNAGLSLTLTSSVWVQISESTPFAGVYPGDTTEKEAFYSILVDNAEVDSYQGSSVINFNGALGAGTHQIIIDARGDIGSASGNSVGEGIASTYLIKVNASPVPEPATWLGLCFGVALAAVFAKRAR